MIKAVEYTKIDKAELEDIPSMKDGIVKRMNERFDKCLTAVMGQVLGRPLENEDMADFSLLTYSNNPLIYTLCYKNEAIGVIKTVIDYDGNDFANNKVTIQNSFIPNP